MYVVFLFLVFLLWHTPAFTNHATLRVDPFNTNPVTSSGQPSGSFGTQLREALDHEIAQSNGRHFTSYVHSGGLHGTATGLTTTTFATEAFLPERVNQTATAITYAAIANDVCWTIISSDNNGITGWTRVGTTAYYYQCEGDTTPTEPTLPANSTWLMRTIIANSAISRVKDMRIPRSYATRDVYDITDPLYGAIGDGITNNAAAIQAAANAVPEFSISTGVGGATDRGGAGVVSAPPGVFRSDSMITLARRGLILQGSGGGQGGATVFTFPAGVHGFLITRLGLGTATDPYYYGINTTIKDCYILALGTTTRAHGVSMTMQASLQNVTVQGFATDGIHIEGAINNASIVEDRKSVV